MSNSYTNYGITVTDDMSAYEWAKTVLDAAYARLLKKPFVSTGDGLTEKTLSNPKNVVEYLNHILLPILKKTIWTRGYSVSFGCDKIPNSDEYQLYFGGSPNSHHPVVRDCGADYHFRGFGPCAFGTLFDLTPTAQDSVYAGIKPNHSDITNTPIGDILPLLHRDFLAVHGPALQRYCDLDSYLSTFSSDDTTKIFESLPFIFFHEHGRNYSYAYSVLDRIFSPVWQSRRRDDIQNLQDCAAKGGNP
jgi:hypothetical protein